MLEDIVWVQMSEQEVEFVLDQCQELELSVLLVVILFFVDLVCLLVLVEESVFVLQVVGTVLFYNMGFLDQQPSCSMMV
jgi:hypothetical protein